MKPCTYKACDRVHHAAGLCKMHYLRQWRGGDMDREPYRKYISPSLAVTILDLYRIGLSTRQIASAFNVSFGNLWKIIQREGLIRSRIDAIMLRSLPTSMTGRSLRDQARKKYQRHHKVLLDRRQHVHHIDHDPTNNSIVNLMVMDISDHARYHHPSNPIPRHLREDRQAYMQRYLKEYRSGNR